MIWFNVKIELYYDSNSFMSKYRIYDKWVRRFGGLSEVYSDNVLKEKIIEIVKDIDVDVYDINKHYIDISIILSEEELFYIQLKYGDAARWLDYQQI